MLDRQFQLKILKMLAEPYPESFDHRAFLREMDDADQRRYAANLFYLDEHGLVQSGISFGINDYVMTQPKITAKGLDFLADDGGLSAILGVVTVRFDTEQLRALIEAKINNSHLATEDKSRLMTMLRSLSAEAIKHLTMKLLDQGLSRLPDAGQLIQALFNQF